MSFDKSYAKILTRVKELTFVFRINLKNILKVVNWETNDYNTHIAQYLKK